MNFVKILDHLKHFGFTQKIIFLSACFVHVFVGMHMLASVFLMGEPKHRCYVPGCDYELTKYDEYFVQFSIPNVTDKYDKLSRSSCKYFNKQDAEQYCSEDSFLKNESLNCDSFIWDSSDFEETTISEFNIVCSNTWNAAFCSSLFMIGFLIGSVGFGMISDKYGRKTVIVISSLILLLSSVSTSFCTSFLTFCGCRFVTAACICGLVQASYVLVVEFIGPSKRVVCSNIVMLMFTVGELVLAGLAYSFRRWRILELAIAIPTSILLLNYFILPESVRWLISKGKYVKAKEQILKVAKWNKCHVPDYLLNNELNDTQMKQKSVGPLSFFKTSRMRAQTLNIFVSWIVNTMVYYGLALDCGHLYGDIYINFSILSAAEMPAVIITSWFLLLFGPRRVLCTFMILTGLCCVSTIFIPPELFWLVTVFTVFARAFIAISFTVVYIYTAEIFPTVLRSTGVGLSSTVGRIGSIAAPIIIQLGDMYHFLPMLIFSIASVLSGLLTLALPETHNECLPETIEDVENIGIFKEEHLERKSDNEERNEKFCTKIS